MANIYEINNKTLNKVWVVISKDVYIRQNNLSVIINVCKNNDIIYDESYVFTSENFNISSIYNAAITPSFFGNKLIVIKDVNLSKITDDDINSLGEILNNYPDNYFAFIFDFDDERKLNNKKFETIFHLAKENNSYLSVLKIDDNYLVDIILNQAKKNNTIISKKLAQEICQNIPKDVYLAINEVDKFCAAANYTEITAEIIANLSYQTAEASVFEIIDLVCTNKPVKAIKKLNNLFENRVDEIIILASLSTAFIDIYRCKIAAENNFTASDVNKDFEKNAKIYRYQKAMNNSNKFSKKAIAEILELLLKLDIEFKSTASDKQQSLEVLLAQIVSKR